MADNIRLNQGAGGDLLAAKDRGGVKHERMLAEFDDSPSIDAFGRLRVSEPFTVFASKLLAGDDAPLFWDEQLEDGAGITASTPTAAKPFIDYTSMLNTAGVFTRQTFRRFNYQPGKALRHGEPVLTPTGWVSIEDMKVGDKVFDGTGVVTDVVGVYPQGEREVVRVTFDDGTHVDCDMDHLWKTTGRQNSQKGKARILSTRQMLDEYGEEPPSFARWRIPAAPILQFGSQDVPIDPYTLGAILGDGHIGPNGYTSITTADPELLTYLRCEEVTKQPSHKYAYGLRGLSEDIRALDLAGSRAHTKHIPDVYKYNDVAVRCAVLQGLMDTDGTVDRRDGTAGYASVSKQLAEDLAFLVRSLGGQAKIRWRETGYYDEDGERHVFPSYRVTVIMPTCPFRLERKASLWYPRTRVSFDRYVHTIVPIGHAEATCIRVSSDDHTFLTRNHVVTHNSQLITMTGVLNLSGGGAGVERRIGLFDDDNGLFFEDDAGTVGVTVRSNVTGTPVDTTVTQGAPWNLDAMDGSGDSGNPSGITADFTKAQIFVIDYQWLSVGRVRFGLEIDGLTFYVHEVLSANVQSVPYMSTPNLPLRYQMVTTGVSPASTMRVICSTVVSEAGQDPTGLTHTHATTDHVNANVADVLYALVGIRLKSTALGCDIEPVVVSLISETKDDFEWQLIFNPTVAGTFDYTDKADSCVQTATGNTDNPSTNTVTNGTVIGRGFVENNGAETIGGRLNSLELGAAIDGTQDTLVLVARPLSANADLQGSLTWREIF